MAWSSLAKLKSAEEVARRSGGEDTRETRVPPNEIIDTPEQKLYTVALSSKRIRRRQLDRIRSHHNFNIRRTHHGWRHNQGRGAPEKKEGEKEGRPKESCQEEGCEKVEAPKFFYFETAKMISPLFILRGLSVLTSATASSLHIFTVPDRSSARVRSIAGLCANQRSAGPSKLRRRADSGPQQPSAGSPLLALFRRAAQTSKRPLLAETHFFSPVD